MENSSSSVEQLDPQDCRFSEKLCQPEVSCPQKKKVAKSKKAVRNPSDSFPRSGERLCRIEEVSRPQKKKMTESKKGMHPDTRKPKEYLEDMFAEKLYVGKNSRKHKKTKAMKCKDEPENLFYQMLKNMNPSMIGHSEEKTDQDFLFSWFSSSQGKEPYEVEPEFWSKEEPEVAETIVDGRYVKEAMERKEDLEDFLFGVCERMETLSNLFAAAAISYLREQGCNLELVKAGLYQGGYITFGWRMHFNFKAKKAGDPSAAVVTYFGQLRYHGDSKCVMECCVPLGESKSLPYERDNRGCKYCTVFVHHPIDGCMAMIWGEVVAWSDTTGYLVF